jgi:DnaJ-class molecular chaperone
MTIESYPCPDCKGTGDDKEEPWRVCTWCHGNKVMYREKVIARAIPEPTDEPPSHEITEGHA